MIWLKKKPEETFYLAAKGTIKAHIALQMRGKEG
jgi:hypothetical protein